MATTFYPGQTDYINQLNSLVAGGSVTYATNTFTPVLAGATTAGTGSYSVQSGKYTHTGNRVDFTATITLSAHTGTGTTVITGLPFADTGAILVPVTCRISNAAFSAQVDAYISPSSSQITIPNFLLASPLGGYPLTVSVTGNYQG